MSEVRLVRGPDPQKISTYPDLRRYDVYLDGKRIGHVQSDRTAHYRKAGRLRTGLAGHPKVWDAFDTTGKGVGMAYSRGDAVRRLVEAVSQ